MRHDEEVAKLVPTDECTAEDDADLTPAGDAIAADAVTEPSDLAAWRWDLSTGEIWWSPELYAMVGVDPTRFRPSLSSVAPMLATVTEEELVRRAREVDAGGVYEVTRPDGGRRLLKAQCWPMAGRTRRQLFGTCRDVTQASGAYTGHERLRGERDAILRATRDGICGLGADGRITFANPAFLRLVQREGEEIGGRRLHDLVHRDGAGAEVHAVRECPFTCAAQPGTAVDSCFHRADGSTIEVGYERVSAPDGVSGIIVSFRDITARRAAARLLQTSLRQVQALSEQRGALLGDLAAAEERERLRIAADIHDDTIQALGAVALRLSNAGERVSGDAERDAFADAEIEVRTVAERLRRLMFELMPPDGERDLRAALHTYCSVLFSSSIMTYELVGDAGELPPDRCLIAYRLIQEIVRNALKHSHGSRVRIELHRRDDELVAQVTDDGVGLGEQPVAPTHAGLRIVRKRAQAAGATALFGPGPDGRGSSIELRLPLTTGTQT